MKMLRKRGEIRLKGYPPFLKQDDCKTPKKQAISCVESEINGLTNFRVFFSCDHSERALMSKILPGMY